MVKFFIPEGVEERLYNKSIEKNGCGSGWSKWLVPDSFLLWDFTIPCAIHDEMYFLGKTIEDKDEADRVFLNNMLREAESKCWFIRKFSRKSAYVYYEAVVKYGGPAYWADKNDEKRVISLVKNAGMILKEVL